MSPFTWFILSRNKLKDELSSFLDSDPPEFMMSDVTDVRTTVQINQDATIEDARIARHEAEAEIEAVLRRLQGALGLVPTDLKLTTVLIGNEQPHYVVKISLAL